MTPQEATLNLTEITNKLIREEIDFLNLKNATSDLKSLFIEVSGIDIHDSLNEKDIKLKTGKAIGPKWAGMCVDDMMRTKRYITGIYKAVKSVQQIKKNTPVCILYSGTGPFATLVMPLITLFKPSEIQFVLVEINPLSVASLKNTIDGFNANDYIKEIHQCDASTFQVPSSYDVDIVIIECMQHALNREPQVVITYNLISQLKKEVILIPKQISLHIALIDSKKRNKYLMELTGERKLDFYNNSKAVFILNKEEVLKNKNVEFSKEEILFSEKKLKQNDMVAITTEITVFDDEKLTFDDSGLTIPHILGYLNDKKIKGVTTQYVVSEEPRLVATLIR